MRSAAGVVVTGLCLWLAARNVDFSELGRALSGADPFWLAGVVAVGIVDLFLRAWRWRVLLSGAKPAPLGLVVRLQSVGIALNNVLFMRLGELARAALAARQLKIPLLTSLASVVVERVLDLVAMLTLFSLAAAGSPQVPAALRHAGLLALAGFCTILAAAVFAHGPLSAHGVVGRRLARWPKIQRLAAQLSAGAAVLRRPGPALLVLALGWGVWSIDALVFWTAARALGIGETVGYGRSVLVLCWGGLGAALPAVPGGFGTFEAFVKAILQSFGVLPAQALAFAVVTHMVMYIWITLLGLYFLSEMGLSPATIESVREVGRAEALSAD